MRFQLIVCLGLLVAIAHAQTTVCTVTSDCSGHAMAVSGTSASGCTCTCRNGWTGAQCQTCAPNYDASSDCSKCAAGYVNYPTCERICTVTSDCSGHAMAVSGTSASGCTCTCRNGWTGAQCQTCAPNYDASSDCSKCAAGYVNYPTCEDVHKISGNAAAPAEAHGSLSRFESFTAIAILCVSCVILVAGVIAVVMLLKKRRVAAAVSGIKSMEEPLSCEADH